MLLTFGDNSSHEIRAYRIYLILIGLAANHQTIAYWRLCEKIRYDIGPMVCGPLGRLVNWCIREGLPALTSLVVEKETGKPSSRWTVGRSDELPAELQRVFAFDWFSIMPPTLKELREY
jgi:hypothetical protein